MRDKKFLIDRSIAAKLPKISMPCVALKIEAIDATGLCAQIGSYFAFSMKPVKRGHFMVDK